MEFVKILDKLLPKHRPIGHHDVSVPIPGSSVTRELEKKLAEYCGTRQCTALSSGTAALHLALLALGVKPGDEVLVPSLTYVATANAVRYCGGIPHFIDGWLNVSHFKLRTYLANFTHSDPNRVGRINTKTGRHISAIIVVDLLGFPADYDKLEKVASDFGLGLIEDAAESLGSSLGGRMCGSFGNAGIFSFNINKIVTGDGGGALLTNDEWITANAAHLGAVARVPHKWLVEADALGYNYRITGSSSTIIMGQLERLEKILEVKRAIHKMYSEALADCDEVEILTAKEKWEGEPNYWLSTAMLKPLSKYKLPEVMEELHKKGIGARALFTPLHTLPIFKDCPRMDCMSYCEATAKRAICLPSGLGLYERTSPA